MNTFTAPDGQIHTWPFPNIQPREVQLRALSKGYGKPGFAYFMRQRLGKTWVAYAEFTLLREQGLCDWFVLICPNSLKLQWVQAIEEVDMFTPIHIYNSNNKSKTEYFFKKNKTGGVFIINYESVRAFNHQILTGKYSRLFDPKRGYIVADESTKIKEPSSKMAKASHDLSLGNIIFDMPKFEYKRILTGRPTSNTNLDIWAQLKFIDATHRNFFSHKYQFCVMGGYQGRQVKQNINVGLLQDEIAPVSYIAEDKYIVGFEKVYEPMRRINLTGRLKELYNKMQDELIIQMQEGVNIEAPIILVQYLRLQQISAGVAGDTDGNQHNLIEPSQNPRIRAVKDLLENEITNKVIIVCRFRLSVQNLYSELSKEGYNVCTLVGGMKPEAIETAKREFNEGDTHIMLAQIQVLNFGHTLCASDEVPCDSMIFYENDFSLINRSQCESRPEKFGRDKPISYYDIYASKMDRYLLESLIKKEEASLALMNYARSYGMRPQGVTADEVIVEDHDDETEIETEVEDDILS